MEVRHCSRIESTIGQIPSVQNKSITNAMNNNWLSSLGLWHFKYLLQNVCWSNYVNLIAVVDKARHCKSLTFPSEIWCNGSAFPWKICNRNNVESKENNISECKRHTSLVWRTRLVIYQYFTTLFFQYLLTNKY